MPIESTCTDVIDLCSDDDETPNPKRPVKDGIGPSSPFSTWLKLDEQEKLKFQGEWFSKQEQLHSKPPQVGEAYHSHNVSGNSSQCRAYGAFPQKPGLFNNRTDVLDGGASYVAQDSPNILHTNLMSSNHFPSTPAASVHQRQMSRRFWKAGDYNVQCKINSSPSGGLDHVRVHPKFLHSNATSHKWALGAVAELLDNALDEVRNGATYVRVDALKNPTDGGPMLLVQDDGGGMDPDCMRECMSLGYSRKTTKTTIGQYGNGFKTSTMRLGADVVVFSRSIRDGRVSESIGLLSYTFLHETGKEDIVVPMVDFEIPFNGGMRKVLLRGSQDDWLHNLSIILQWSPYKTQEALLNQFSEIGSHGTRIIVYNLWLNDDGELELDFDSDKKDIQLRGGCKHTRAESLQKQMTNQHISNRLRYSLRAYSSILYLHMPEHFQIILRGEVVQHLSIAEDLKFPECILYKPQVNYKDFGGKEVSVITTIGFAKEAPMVNVHGFNVYHKNRLIMPFWRVFHENSSRGKGVVGVLEANFMEPAHDKQDFERTPILQRLESRLKQMTIEYWNLHCELIGYQPPNKQMSVKPTTTSIASSRFSTDQQLGRNHAEDFLHAPFVSGTSAEFAGAATNGSQFSQSNNGRSYTVSPFLPPHSDLSNSSGHVSSFLQPASKEAHGTSSNVCVGGASNMVVDVKPCPPVLHSVTLNQLHPVINTSADVRAVCEEDGLINAVQKSSLCNFSSSTKSASFSASAPSTPPQPGSDIGLLCKQVDTVSDGTSNSCRVASAYDCADGHVWAQSTSSEKSTTVGKRNLDDQEVVFSKRLATQVKESVPISEENAATLNGSSATPDQTELLEEVKQLRLRCSHYEWEKRQLQLKIYELQLALAQMQQKENVCSKEAISISKKEL